MQKQIIGKVKKLVLLGITVFMITTSFGQKTGGNITDYTPKDLSGVVSTTKVLDADGNIRATIRNYSEDMLPPFISNRIHKKFPGKKVWGVTEVSSEEGTQYKVFLVDDKKWYHLSATSNGEVYLDEWYYKS